MKKDPHIGSSFDDFLDDDGTPTETSAAAIKRVLAGEISKAMKDENITKTAMARRMKTSRAALDRLLSPGNTSVTLNTMDRAAKSLGKSLKIELADAG
jgi:plasmid maintenance system antidote protein VapI